jgi:hypothetical protein
LPLVAIVTANLEGVIRHGRHVKDTVGQGIELPVAAVIVFRQVIGKGIDGRLNGQWKMQTKQLSSMAQALMVGNLLAGDGGCVHSVVLF